MTFIKLDLITNKRENITNDTYSYLIDFLIDKYPLGFDIPTDIYINSKKIELEEYDTTLRKEDIVTILSRPGVAAAAVGAVWAFVINTAISLAISYIIQEVFAPSKLAENIEEGQQADIGGSSTYNLNNSRNTTKLGAPIPIIYGTVRTYPAMIMTPYKQHIRGIEYLNHLMCIGQGTFNIEDIFIDKTSVLNHPDVEYCLLTQADFNDIPAAVNAKLGYSGTATFDSDVIDILSTPTNLALRTYKMPSHIHAEFDYPSGDGYYTQCTVYQYGGDDFSRYTAQGESPSVYDDMRIEFFNPNDFSEIFNFYGWIASITDNGFAQSDRRFIKKYIIELNGEEEAQAILLNTDYGIVTPEGDTSRTLNKQMCVIEDSTTVPGCSHYMLHTRYGNDLPYGMIPDNVFGTEVTDQTTGDYRYADFTFEGKTAKINIITKKNMSPGNDLNSYFSRRIYFNFIEGQIVSYTSIPTWDDDGDDVIDTSNGEIVFKSVYSTINFTKKTTPIDLVLAEEEEDVSKCVLTAELRGGCYIQKRGTSEKIPIKSPYFKLIGLDCDTSGEEPNYSVLYFEDDVTNTFVDTWTAEIIAPKPCNMPLENMSVESMRPAGNMVGDMEEVTIRKITKHYDVKSHLDYGDITLLYVRMKATNAISQIGQMKVNALVTRTDVGNKLKEVCKDIYSNSTYGSNLPAEEIVFSAGEGSELINGVYDKISTVFDALKMVSNPHKYRLVPTGANIEFRKDQIKDYAVSLFNEYNILHDSFSVNLVIQEEHRQEDCYKVAYRDAFTFEEKYEYYPSKLLRPLLIKTFGLTDSNIAQSYCKYQYKQKESRKKIVTFRTDIQGMIPTFNDKILISHGSIRWGLDAGLIVKREANIITLSDDLPNVENSGVIYFKRTNGSATDSYNWTRLTESTISIIGLEEDINVRSYYTLGEPQEFIVTEIKPGAESVTITAVNYDASIYS